MRAAYDLVVEIYTVQALPRTLRTAATAAVGSLVAAGGTLVVIQAVLGPDEDPAQGPPWPLTRTEIEAFATGDPVLTSLDSVPEAGGWSAPAGWPPSPVRPERGRSRGEPARRPGRWPLAGCRP